MPTQAGAAHWLSGVPMHWMTDWPMPHLPLVAKAHGARIADLDGQTLDDFCLGDTGSMFGHSPAPVAKAIRQQARQGLTYMLPTEDAIAVGRLLEERFGLPHWQVATTATDANGNHYTIPLGELVHRLREYRRVEKRKLVVHVKR